MGYLHIENLYRPAAQILLNFKRLYALEKVHGTSAHVAWRDGKVHYHAGGESHSRFVALFDDAALTQAFQQLGHDAVTVYGEAYGGQQQGMRHTYGDELRFIVFDIMVSDTWLTVPNMADVAAKLGLEVVPWSEVDCDLMVLDALRDAPSEVAVRRGIVEPKPREGIVLRPLVELTTSNGSRVIAKHKGAAFSETESPRPVVDPAKLAVLTEAQSIADEWVTDERLRHVLQRLPDCDDIKATPRVIAAMVEDILREGSGEIVDSRDARAAIGRKTAAMFKAQLATPIRAAAAPSAVDSAPASG